MVYTNYQQQAVELAEICVELLKELDNVNSAYCEILCRKLYKFGYIDMNKDEYILEFIRNGRLNVKKRKEE